MANYRGARITHVERMTLWVPFHESARLDMERAGIDRWSEVELLRVDSDAGVSGWGETIQNYTWGRVPDVDRVIGRSPFELMWNDSLGSGLQMALLDLAGKLAEVPAHALLGQQVRSHCPISYWYHDASPATYQEQARRAVSLGYTSLKIKARPWWDVYETIEAISNATPDWFAIDADWNDFLLDAQTATSILGALEDEFPKLKIFEGPIRSTDVAGNRELRRRLRTPTAHHYGKLPGSVILMQRYCGGFVVSGGLSQIMAAGRSAGAVNMPLFLQLVGTGLTTALCLHVGSVLPAARWPAVTCYELYQHPLILGRHALAGGLAAVPTAPGLGVEVDPDALARFQVSSAEPPLPRRLIRYSRASGLVAYFVAPGLPDSSFWNYFAGGNQPVFERGVSVQLIDDDSGSRFDDLFQRASSAPVITSGELDSA
jgi:L-alanine-DL-glutamate epimerase-like enolase superfamily enzyme